ADDWAGLAREYLTACTNAGVRVDGGVMMSGGTRTQALESAGRHADAAAAAREQLEAFIPLMEGSPQILGDWAVAYAKEYLTACKNAGAEVDAGLIVAVVQAHGGSIEEPEILAAADKALN